LVVQWTAGAEKREPADRKSCNMAPWSHAAFSDDLGLLSVCGADGKLKVFDTKSNKLVQEYVPDGHLNGQIRSLCWISAPAQLELVKIFHTIFQIFWFLGSVFWQIRLFKFIKLNLVVHQLPYFVETRI
jgi:WD40 repeat protein